jgi:3',5'-cyclic AMP phosphodiesterase CpdA
MATRIAHFTDIHFTELPSRVPLSKLMSKRLVGWANMKLLGRYADFEDTALIARALTKDLANQDLDGIVFTGDLTGLALETEFMAAKQALDPLLNDPRVVGIPGNHDVYTFGSSGAFEQHFAPWLRSDVDSAHPYPIVRTYEDKVAVIAVKDVRPCLPHDSSGYLPKGQIERVRHLVQGLQDHVIILAMHYCIRMQNQDRDSYFHRLRNDQQVMTLAEDLGVDLIICGHVHHRTVHKRGEGSPVAFANPGSVSHGRRGRIYHLLTIENGNIELSARQFDAESGSFREWAEAPQSGRL